MKIQIEKKENKIVCLRLEGELDILSSNELKEASYKLITEKNLYILLDFSRVDYLGSSGVLALFDLLRHIKFQEGSLAIFGMKEGLFNIIRIASLDKILPIFSSKEEALLAFGPKVRLGKRGKNFVLFYTYGEIDKEGLELLEKEALPFLKEKTYLLINFQHTKYIDSMGLGKLVLLAREAQSRGGNLYLCGLNGEIREVFRYTEIDRIISVFDSEEEAMSAIG